MSESDIDVGDIVLVEYEHNNSVEPMYLGVVSSMDVLGAEVEEVRRITKDDVMSGFKDEGWNIQKVGVEYDEENDKVKKESGKWVDVNDILFTDVEELM